ncbi:MAG TPA: molybdenum cofactor biosynthesis protein MoaE [Myxococcota bacterium]|nr:molybdenum cofactor biosynthesis protein MoaE [Myxococcota bacterium]HND32108.1 molybdenum cofactor biosynthesis protein MoaE [Myxococcota bacterium]
MIALTSHPLSVAAIEATVAGPQNGALLSFVGVARCTPAFGERAVVGLDYEAYGPMALAELLRIHTELCARWPELRLAMVHRVGALSLGEPVVVVSVGSPHRALAYDASRAAIEALKARVPIWKKEIYADGSAWTSNRP